MRALYRTLLNLSQRREPFAVCTVVDTTGSVPGKLGSMMVVTPTDCHGTVGGAGLEERVKTAALKALATGEGQGVHHFDLANWKPGGLDSVCGGSVAVSILVHRPLPHLLIIGGGHCGKALSDLAALVDWDVTVVDARPEYASRDRFPNAVDVIAQDPAHWCRTADLTPYSHALLLGHSWELDAKALVELLPRFHGYVGAIGSGSKRKALHRFLRDAGVRDADAGRLVCPIGIDIGAEAPEEIALSIAAQLLASLRRETIAPLEATP